MTENSLSGTIVSAAFNIHSKLGPGLLESVYESIPAYELSQYQLYIKRQYPVPVIWKSHKLDVGFRVDLIVEDKVIIELKSIEALAPVHYKQLLTYLKLTNIKLGLLIDFNEVLIRTGIHRVVNGL